MRGAEERRRGQRPKRGGSAPRAAHGSALGNHMTQRNVERGIVRRLWRTDLDAFRAHLLRLDRETRRNRFAGAVADSYVARYAEQAIAGDGLVVGFVAGGAVRGVAEMRAGDPPHDNEAEAAFSVEEPFRRHGVGDRLCRRLLLAARNRGIRVLHVCCLPHNEAMQAMARKHGARLLFDGDDMLGRLETGTATPFSLAEEAWAESLTFPAALWGLQRPSPAAAAACG